MAKAKRFNAKGDGCLYDPETHEVETSRDEDTWLTDDELVERILRAQFQLAMLKQAIKDMTKLRAGKPFKGVR